MFFHRETSSLKMNKLNVIIWVWLFACSNHATTWLNICYMKPARQLLTRHATCCGCATPAAPLKQTHLLCGCATLAAPLHSSTSHETTIWECTSWSMTFEWNHLPIWQNPKLQIIKVACNSQLLKSSSSSHATLTASFSFSSSKPSLHLGLSRSSTICGCDTWIQSQPKAIPRKTSSFLKSIQLLLNSRTVWDSLPGWIMRDI